MIEKTGLFLGTPGVSPGALDTFTPKVGDIILKPELTSGADLKSATSAFHHGEYD